MMPSSSFHILLVEDCPGDVGLIRHVLRERDDVKISIAGDGERAIGMLSGPDAPIPDLILLDLNLPRRTGFEVLEVLRADPRLKTIPVAVLTSSGADRDVNAAYLLGANCYIVKPVSLDEFHQAITRTVSFWQTLVTRPPRRMKHASC